MHTEPPAVLAPDRAARAQSPYVGLNPYTVEDTAFFFGRDKDTEIITANLIAARLTLLYGTSGVGKSSVLQAGVMAGLHENARREMKASGTPEYIVVYFKSWRDEPISELLKTTAEAIHQTLPNVEVAPATTLPETLQAWSEQTGAELLLILDQFEEYFTYHPNEDSPGSFAQEFPRALKDADLRANFLLSFREDALSQLDRFKGYIPNLFKNILRVKHLDLNAGREVIRKPIDIYNKLRPAGTPAIEIQDRVVEAVLEQVRVGQVVVGESGRGTPARENTEVQIETPYLQLVLTRLWERERELGSNVLRLETLEQLGGAKEIVRGHLQNAIDALTPQQQAIAASVFDRLVTPSGTKIAQNVHDLAQNAHVSEQELNVVLGQLASGQNRILRAVAPAPEQPGILRYEIFHDVLSGAILEWRAQYEKNRELVASEARAREERAKAEQQLKQQQTEETLELERKANVRQRRLLTAGAVLLVVAIVASGIAGILFLQARAQRELAEQQERVARSRELASVANGQLGTDPELSILLALEANKSADTVEASSALRRALSVSRLRGIVSNAGDSIRHVTYSQDGKWFAFDRAHTVRVFSAADSQLVTTLPIGAQVRYLQFSPDSQKLVTYDDSFMVQVWDSIKGTLTAANDFNSSAFAAQFSPDSKLLAISGDVKSVLWNLETGDVQRQLTLSHVGAINIIVYSPDGRKIVTAGSGAPRVWDVTNGQELFQLKGQNLGVVDIAFSPDSSLLVTSGNDNTARIWDAGNGEELAVLHHDAPVTRALFSPDSRFVATASSRTANTWDAATGHLIANLRGHTALITDIAFSPDGTQLTTTSLDGTARVWEPFSGNLVTALLGHTDAVNSFAYSPDGKRILTAGNDGTARIWDAVEETSVAQLLTLDAPPQRAVMEPNGRILATGSSNGSITVWDLDTRSALLTFPAHSQPVVSLAVSANGTTLASAGLDSRVVLWNVDLRSKRATARLERTLRVNALAFSPDGIRLVTVDDDGAVVIRDVGTLDPIGVQPPPQQANLKSVAWSGDGKRMAWGGSNGIVLWDTAASKPIVTVSDQSVSALAMQFSPDSRRLLFGSGDNIARVWNAESGELLLTLRGHGGPVDAVAFSADNQFLVTGSWDNTARVWEAATGNPVRTLGGHTEDVTGVFYALDGKNIVTTSADGTIQLHECVVCVDTHSLVALAKQRVTRPLACEEQRTYLHETVACPTSQPAANPTLQGTAAAAATLTPEPSATAQQETPTLVNVVPTFTPQGTPVPATPKPTSTPPSTATAVLSPTPCSVSISISGVVFNDDDKSGKRDGKEQGIAGVTVNLYDSVAQDTKPIASTTTDASGNYAFSSLPGGSYTVAVISPRNFLATTDIRQAVNLETCQTRRGIDFGFQRFLIQIPPVEGCLPAGTLIDTPKGSIPVKELRIGMQVWTVTRSGERVVGEILETSRRTIPKDAILYRVVLKDGRSLLVSGSHPMLDGNPIESLTPGDILDRARVVVVERVPFDEGATFDILPSGETGGYWASGILIGSTLTR